MRYTFMLVFATFIIKLAVAQEYGNVGTGLPSIPLITTYTPTEYSGGIQNWSIHQDTLGYIYVANNYGLLEFDGASWENYPISGSTKSRTVLVHKNSNKIYLGGQKQLGFFERTKEGLKYKSLIDSIPDELAIDEVLDLTVYGNDLFGVVSGRIIKISNDRVSILEGITNVEFLSQFDNDLIAGSTNGLYLNQNNEGFRLIEQSNENYRGALKIGSEYLVFTYDGDIFKYDGSLKRIKTQVDNFLSIAKINKVLLLSNGNIVIATQNNGLIILSEDLEPVLHLTKNKGLNHRTVLSLYEDNYQNLWVGLNNGISVVELGSPFSLINENLGLKGTGYSATTHRKTPYLGTSSGLFKPIKDPKFSSDNMYSLIQGSEGLVNNISVIDDQVILSHHEGAFQLESENVNQFFQETGSWGFKKVDDSRLIGGTYLGFYIFNREEGYRKTKLKGLLESSRIFEFKNDSTLWMTHGYKGVYKLILNNDTIKRIKRYGSENGFPSDILISVYSIANELIFTAETGIYRYNQDADRFEPHPFLNTFFKDRHVSKIREGSDQSIYFIADGKMGVLKRKALGVYEIEEKLFRKINKFISDDLENISILRDNSLLIGAKEGFLMYRPDIVPNIQESFNTHLKTVSITDQSDQESVISGQFFKSQSIDKPKRLKFEYSSPYLDGLNQIEYAYRLTPHESEWSEWSETNWKEYTNLPADEYTFEVKARNVYENQSTISKYEFSIAPEWFETTLAYAAYASLVLFIFTSVLLARERKHKVEKRHINLSKEKLIQSKEREINEFSEKTNQEIQSLKNESLKKEIDHKNSELASVTMHLLSKNEFVMSLRKKLNDAITDKDNTDSLSKIVKSIDRNIDEDEAWETFAHHFDQVHGNFLHKIKEEVRLTPQETKLCAYLKMNMSTKDIANLMNITIRGVELARYRLRKKLGIQRETNLAEYLDQY